MQNIDDYSVWLSYYGNQAMQTGYGCQDRHLDNKQLPYIFLVYIGLLCSSVLVLACICKP